MKSFFRTFGIAFFLIGALLAGGNQWHIPFFSSKMGSETKEQATQIEKLQQQVETSQEEVEHLQQTIAQMEKEMQQDVKDKPVTNIEQAEDENKKTGIIYVYEGVSIYDIGKQAEDAGILVNGRELELFLSKPEYARSIQKGQFELNSSMTLEQMARILTGKKVQ